MHFFFTKNKYFLFLLIIFIICEIIVNPIGEFPLNDDWAYSKSVSFAIHGVYTIGDFGAMTLFTHLLWGTIFTKIFGFSFTVLRFSTLISSLIGLFFLNKLIVKISNNLWLGFFSCLVLLFNPLYFSLTNTYMTDVNFTTLLILSCYCAFVFFDTKKEIYIYYFLLLSIGLVLIRQFGIILPICFFVSCITLKEKRKRYLIISFIVIVITLGVLKFYESILKHSLSYGAAYTFSGSIDLLSYAFWENFFVNIAGRYKVILVHIFIYGFPLAIIYLASIIRSVNKIYAFTVSIICIFGCYFLLQGNIFPFHNMFTNMCIGPETFHESNGHTRSTDFATLCDIVKYVFSSFTFIVLILFLSSKIKLGKAAFKFEPEVLFLVLLLGMYIFMILITQKDVYFDRYHLPIIALIFILFSFMNKTFKAKYSISVLILFCFFYLSVFGTKDYLTLNRNRWDAYYFIKDRAKVDAEKINGGFEVNCWNDGKNNWWADYGNLQNYDYLIQFNEEKSFKTLREYEFQRYFPFKKDTIRLLMRVDTAKTATN
ncbi:MAG: glycosyltransferase family 39 protein [Bacteroidia bacterium]|nr:glycosyltransferase family 39 protein [Bacteroidia bacterium]